MKLIESRKIWILQMESSPAKEGAYRPYGHRLLIPSTLEGMGLWYRHKTPAGGPSESFLFSLDRIRLRFDPPKKEVSKAYPGTLVLVHKPGLSTPHR